MADTCVAVPLEGVLKGPGQVAQKPIQQSAEDEDDAVQLNDEQILVIALMVCPLVEAWRKPVEDALGAGRRPDGQHLGQVAQRLRSAPRGRNRRRRLRQDNHPAESGYAASRGLLPQGGPVSAFH